MTTNYYNVGLEMEVRIVGPGRVVIGAVYEQDRTPYQKAAQDWYIRRRSNAIPPTVWDIVAVKPNQERMDVSRHAEAFDTMALALDRWRALLRDPGTAWEYFALMNPDKDPTGTNNIEDEYFNPPYVSPPAPVAPAPTKKSGNMGLVVGIAAAAIGGLVMFKPKKGGHL